MAAWVDHNQGKQKIGDDRHSKSRTLEVGDAVYVRNFGTGPKWLAGELLERRGPVSFTVWLEDGRLLRRHVDHLRIHRVLTGALSLTVVPPEDTLALWTTINRTLIVVTLTLLFPNLDVQVAYDNPLSDTDIELCSF